MEPAQHNAFLQLSMMINKVPFVLEAAGSIAPDYKGHAVLMSESFNRSSLSLSLCALLVHNGESCET